MTDTDVTTQRAALVANRDKAEHRVGELEAEQRAAVQTFRA